MATARDAARIREGLASVTALAQDELRQVWANLDLEDREGTIQVLLEVVPALNEQFGAMAASVAALWYEELRSSSGAPGEYEATSSPPYPQEAVENRVRSAAAHLFDGEPGVMLDALLYSMDKFVKQAGRDTIVDNGRADRLWAPRFARIPSGSETCGFCLMLASRGPVYLTRETAGRFNKYHGSCDCAVVPIGPNDPLPAGYDPDALYEEYLAARDRTGVGRGTAGDARAISREIERGRIGVPAPQRIPATKPEPQERLAAQAKRIFGDVAVSGLDEDRLTTPQRTYIKAVFEEAKAVFEAIPGAAGLAELNVIDRPGVSASAWVTSYGDGRRTLSVNLARQMDQRTFRNSLDVNHFHAESSTSGAKYLIAHELAHSADSADNWVASSAYLQKIRETVDPKGELKTDAGVLRRAAAKNLISKYATVNGREALAEAFATTFTSPQVATELERYGYSVLTGKATE